MNYLITVLLLTFVGVQALAKIQIPFQKISLKPTYDLVAELQVPMAVSSSRFVSELAKDCHDFAGTMNHVKDLSLKIQRSDYDGIRFRALPLSMKPSYEVNLVVPKELILEPAFESAKIIKYNLEFKLSKDALTLRSFQEAVTEYILSLDGPQMVNLTLQFKSRDLFCDYYFGNLIISLKADMQLRTKDSVQVETEKKLTQILNSLNDIFKISVNKKLQAVHLGLETLKNSPQNWRADLNTIFSELVNSENLFPRAFWSEKQSDFYALNFSQLHNISEQKFFLKGRFNE